MFETTTYIDPNFFLNSFSGKIRPSKRPVVEKTTGSTKTHPWMDGRALSSSSSPANTNSVNDLADSCWKCYLAKLQYFTNMDFPDRMGIPLHQLPFAGEILCARDLKIFSRISFWRGEKWQDFPNLNFRDVFGRISLNKNPWVTKGTNCEKSFWSQITARNPDDHPLINCTSLLRKWSWMTWNIHFKLVGFGVYTRWWFKDTFSILQ